MLPKRESLEDTIAASWPPSHARPAGRSDLLAVARLLDVRLDDLQAQLDALKLDGLKEDIEDDIEKPVLQMKLDRLQTSLDMLRGQIGSKR